MIAGTRKYDKVKLSLAVFRMLEPRIRGKIEISTYDLSGDEAQWRLR